MSVFTRADFQKLQSIVMTIVDQPMLVITLYNTLDQSDFERFSKALVECSRAAGTTVPLLKDIIQSDFEKNKNTTASIMRGNTSATKLMSLYCRSVGGKYIKNVIGELVREIIEDDELDLEVDPAKMDENVSESKLVEQRALLQSWIQHCVEHITSPEAIELLPKTIKALCFYVKVLADEYAPDNVVSLVGGFLMLRFINPALIAPESYGIRSKKGLTMRNRRNLTLISKSIQNISNQRNFNEEFLLDLNEYVASQVPTLESYLRAVCIDTAVDDPSVSFMEIIECKEPIAFDVDAVDATHWKFWHNFFIDDRSAIEEAMMEESDELKQTDAFKRFMEALDDYSEYFEARVIPPMDFYYSPLCPFSRMVWLFCLENKIPITLKKVDLLQQSHELDVIFKKFKSYSPHLQVPLIVDGDVIVEESTAILIYLCDKYFLESTWYPFRDFKASLKVLELLSWMEKEVHQPVIELWNVVKEQSILTAKHRRTRSIFSALRQLNDMLARVKIANQSEQHSFVFGAHRSLVDLEVLMIESFAQLEASYAASHYPEIQKIALAYQKASAGPWKKVNSEYLGFSQYILTTCKSDSLPRISHSVIISQPPHTVYETILDPDNDIFRFLASKTISTKTNAKVKKGLKKLNSSDGGEQEMQEREKIPYTIALEVGGKFSINLRDGTNLVLVPGNKIVQESTRPDWPDGHRSTEIFELYALEGGDKCKLVFSQMNCPIAKLRESEDLWERFWRKLNGTRTIDVKHQVFFRGKTPAILYNLLTDWKAYTKATKSKVKLEDDGTFYMHNKSVEGKITQRITNSKIVQNWRCSDWNEELYSVCTILISEVTDIGSRIDMTLTDVPYERLKNVDKTWRDGMWKKLGGVQCVDLEQSVVFRKPPQEVFDLWKDADAFATMLGPKVSPLTAVGESFALANGAIKGTVTKLDADELEIGFMMSHKDWPSQHLSLVNLEIKPNELGSTVEIIQENVPLPKAKAMVNSWTTDLWEKMEAVSVDEIRASIILSSQPSSVYQMLMSGEELSKATDSECVIDPVPNGNVSIFSKELKGKVVSFVDSKSIVWSQRAFDWPVSHFSFVSIVLSEHNGGRGTILTFTQSNVPVVAMPSAQTHWERLSKAIKEHCNK